MKPTIQSEVEHSHCHGGKGVPVEDSPEEALRQCCKAINAAPVPAQAAVEFDTLKFQLQLFALLEVLAPQADRSQIAFCDTGPPRCISFAESVLQRSLFSHAPPFAA